MSNQDEAWRERGFHVPASSAVQAPIKDRSPVDPEPAAAPEPAAPHAIDNAWSEPVPVAVAEDEPPGTHQRRSTLEIAVADLEIESEAPAARGVRPRKSTLRVAPLPAQLARPFSQRFAQRSPRRRWLAICVVGGLGAAIAILAPSSRTPASLMQGSHGAVLGEPPVPPPAAAAIAAPVAPPLSASPAPAAPLPAPATTAPQAVAPATKAGDKPARPVRKSKLASKSVAPAKSPASRPPAKPAKLKNRGVPNHD